MNKFIWSSTEKIKYDNPSNDTSSLEAEIDKLVYKLYGLDSEDIQIIEESFVKE